MLPEFEDTAEASAEVGLVEMDNVCASWYKADIEVDEEEDDDKSEMGIPSRAATTEEFDIAAESPVPMK
jgi:hypothetical protein